MSQGLLFPDHIDLALNQKLPHVRLVDVKALLALVNLKLLYGNLHL
jgi:hypothetical protein